MSALLATAVATVGGVPLGWVLPALRQRLTGRQPGAVYATFDTEPPVPQEPPAHWSLVDARVLCPRCEVLRPVDGGRFAGCGHDAEGVAR